MSFCGRERPRPNFKKMLWHASYVILWAHPEVPGSIPTLDLSFLFCSQTAPLLLIYLFAKFNDTIQSTLNPSKKNGISKKQFFLKSKGHHPGSNRRTLDHKPSLIPMRHCGRERPGQILRKSFGMTLM